MSFSDKFLFVQFDLHTLVSQPKIKSQLLSFYCNIWKYDPNFGEFKKCPVCMKYYDQQQFEVKFITTCSGDIVNPHSQVSLVDAWTEDIVWQNLEPLLQKDQDFYGAVAVDPTSQEIVGFVWGFVSDFQSLSAKWNPILVEQIKKEFPSERVTYFQEIAMDKSYRSMGLGIVLCRMLVRWMKINHPTLPSFLHTHINSNAYPLFQKMGYKLHTQLAGPNAGRILMVSQSGSALTPEGT